MPEPRIPFHSRYRNARKMILMGLERESEKAKWSGNIRLFFRLVKENQISEKFVSHLLDHPDPRKMVGRVLKNWVERDTKKRNISGNVAALLKLTKKKNLRSEEIVLLKKQFSEIQADVDNLVRLSTEAHGKTPFYRDNIDAHFFESLKTSLSGLAFSPNREHLPGLEQWFERLRNPEMH